MEQRSRTFIVLSFCIILGTMMYMQRTAPHRPAGAEGQATGATAPAAATATATATPGMTAAAPQTSPAPAPTPQIYPEGPRIQIKTRVYDVVLSTNGAVPERWDITDPKYVTKRIDQATSETAVEHLVDPKLKSHRELPRPFQTVLQELNSRYYNEFNQAVFTHKQLDSKGLVHQFTSPVNPTGVQMTKTYTFQANSYQVGLNIVLTNKGTSNITFGGGERGLGVVLGPGLGGESNGAPVGSSAYNSVDAILKSEDAFLYEHISRTQSSAGEVTPGVTITQDSSRSMKAIQWGGIVGKYFLTALIPDKGNSFASANVQLDNRVVGTLVEDGKSAGDFPVIEMYGAPFTLQPGQKASFGYTAYVGPLQQNQLKTAGHDLIRALFHSSWDWMRALCMIMLTLLFWMHKVLNNWGLAIISLTIAARLATLPMVHKGLKSQAKMTQQMAKIKPLTDKINEKFKDDPQRKQQEIFKLYREHNINPLGMLKGCVWMMAQAPIMIGLYMVLYRVIDLRGAHFLWIHDLSQPENMFAWGLNVPYLGPYFNLLPIIVAITQMLTSKFMQTPATDPQQQQMQQMMTWMMPIMILGITYRFPSGLMVYWFVSNLWQVVQQIYVNKVIKKPQAAQA